MFARPPTRCSARARPLRCSRTMKRSDVDATYLKNVLIGGFESGELPASSQMLPVLARLLAFSPAELERCRRGVAARPAAGSGGGAASYFKLPSFT